MEKVMKGKVFKGSLSQEKQWTEVEPDFDDDDNGWDKEHKPHCGPEFGLACTCNHDPS